MQEAQSLCENEEVQDLQVKEESEEATQALELSGEESNDTEEEVEDFDPDLEEWDRYDVTVNEFVNVRKSDSFPLNNYKLVVQKEQKSIPKSSLQAPSKDIYESSSALSEAIKQQQDAVATRKFYFIYDERRSFIRNVRLDPYTEVILSNCIKSGFIKQINGAMHVGKETVILHADICGSYKGKPRLRQCVVKVYKLDVSGKDEYLTNDLRVRGCAIKPMNKELAHLLVEKEKNNLIKLKKIGIVCPDFIADKGHVLMMTFIGDNDKPALRLKHARLDKQDCLSAYYQVIDAMKNMYAKADLIHTDLSEHNILWHNKKCYIIDFSQAVKPCSLDVYRFLMDDCVRVLYFFKQKGVENILSPEELFQDITGHERGDTLGLKALIKKFNKKQTPGVRSAR